MNVQMIASRSAAIAAALLLSACGGGGGNTDVRPREEPPAPPPIVGPNSFLLFPNPQKRSDGTLETNTIEYAQAYYAAIDPNNQKDTLAKWKAANGFDTGTGTQISVVFGDVRDLGFGRRMTARQNPDGTVAILVENYQVTAAADYAFTEANLQAAVVRDPTWHPYTNAIEFSPGPNGGVSFTKFYNFQEPTGERELTVNLDGRGEKAMPSLCISCHGGRGDPLTPPDATGRRLFPLVANSVSQHRGDTQARMHPLEPDTFQFSPAPGFTRAEQEAAMKAINRMILCTYPRPAAANAPEDQCRRIASPSEWQGTAAEIIKAAYGGDGLPNATFADHFVPQSWLVNGQSTLNREVIVTECRACPVMSGTGGNSDVDFHTFEKFRGYADRTKVHVFDRGNMPLVRLIFDRFWATGTSNTLATFLDGQGFQVRDAAGNPLRPGRPIADPGPDRVVRPGATRLSAAGSLFANSFTWTLVSGPAGATLVDGSSVEPTFNATADGTYVVQLVAANGAMQSPPSQLRIVVSSQLAHDPASIRFADVKAVLQGTCVSCHSPTGALPRPPIFYTNEDRNGDSMVTAVDDAWMHAEVRGRVNFTDIGASALLRKPAGFHHGGALQSGFNSTATPGDPARANYDLILNWILNGAL